MEKKLRQVVEPWIERINLVFVSCAGILIVIMGFLSAYGAIRRYAFNSPEPVSYEFASMFLLFSFVLANAAVERQGRLLRLDLLLDRFPPRVQNVISNIVSPIMGITFFGVITWISFGDALRALEIGQVSRSAWPVPSVSGETVHSHWMTGSCAWLFCIAWFLGCCVSGEFRRKRRRWELSTSERPTKEDRLNNYGSRASGNINYSIYALFLPYRGAGRVRPGIQYRRLRDSRLWTHGLGEVGNGHLLPVLQLFLDASTAVCVDGLHHY